MMYADTASVHKSRIEYLKPENIQHIIIESSELSLVKFTLNIDSLVS